jgi:uncharacterized membrane protein
VSLAPLLNASPVIQVHAFSAMAAFALGIVQLSAPKGTLPHRTIGWIWVVLLTVIAVSSFWIHELKIFGPFSPIHLLSIFTLVTLPLAVMHARRHRVQKHRNAMIAIFTGALVIAGLFTFVPGRIITLWRSGISGVHVAAKKAPLRTPRRMPQPLTISV